LVFGILFTFLLLLALVNVRGVNRLEQPRKPQSLQRIRNQYKLGREWIRLSLPPQHGIQETTLGHQNLSVREGACQQAVF
jgi:hypothetical protein